jgi:hypothetical protein
LPDLRPLVASVDAYVRSHVVRRRCRRWRWCFPPPSLQHSLPFERETRALPWPPLLSAVPPQQRCRTSHWGVSWSVTAWEGPPAKPTTDRVVSWDTLRKEVLTRRQHDSDWLDKQRPTFLVLGLLGRQRTCFDRRGDVWSPPPATAGTTKRTHSDHHTIHGSSVSPRRPTFDHDLSGVGNSH